MITKKQRRNLAALAIGLENLPKHKRKEHFGMGSYVVIEDPRSFSDNTRSYDGDDDIREIRSEIDENSCGTSACAVGWGLVMGIDIEAAPEEETVQDYMERVFASDGGDDIFDWLFAPRWVAIDDTCLGAAARIRYFLANGVPNLDDDDTFEAYLAAYEELITPYRQQSIEKRIKELGRLPEKLTVGNGYL